MNETGIGLLGIFLGTGLMWFKDYVLERARIKKEATYLAIQVVWLLNKFVPNCHELIEATSVSEYKRNSEGFLLPTVNKLDPVIFSPDMNWKSLDKDLMFKILSFPNEVLLVEKEIFDCIYFDYYPDLSNFFEERTFRYTDLAEKAGGLEKTIRERYGIPVLRI